MHYYQNCSWCSGKCQGHGSNTIRELPVRGKPPTGKLNGWVPVERSLTVGCGHACESCGQCHTAGCRSCRVVCEDAQTKIVSRPNIPKDEHPRKKFLGLF